MTSFSGSDLVVSFGPRVIGELQQISWAVEREKAPVYTLGNPDPRSFSRGKRGIAGSLVFAVFDRDALLVEMKEAWSDIAPKAMFTAAGNLAVQGSEDFENALNMTSWARAADGGNAKSGEGDGAHGGGITSITMGDDGQEISHTQNTHGQSIGFAGAYTGEGTDWTATANTSSASDGTDDKVRVPPGFGVINKHNILYADMLPPLDITMTFANEYGQAAFQKIYDVDFLNEGSGVSVDSIVMERQMTWIARRISPIMEGVYTRDNNGIMSGAAVNIPKQ